VIQRIRRLLQALVRTGIREFQQSFLMHPVIQNGPHRTTTEYKYIEIVRFKSATSQIVHETITRLPG